MSRQPSETTQLRNCKRDLKQALQDYYRVKRDSGIYKLRSERAEREILEWKERFDILLRKEETE